MSRVPSVYLCANPACGRRLETSRYLAELPVDAVADRVLSVWEPNLPAFTILCTCGCFTVVSPRKEPPVGGT